MNVAVTGGLGSGKSTVSKILAVAMSAEHLDTDQLCRQQMQRGNPGFNAFLQVFGNRYLLDDGSLNRQLLRQAVFADSGVKNELEAILHPLVRKQVAEYYTHCCTVGKSLVVEVPLLFEVGWQKDFAMCVVVYVPEELCFSRVAVRDGFSVSEIQRVCATQLPLSEKLKFAHFVIDNSGTFVSTVQQVAWFKKNLQAGQQPK
ncbi:MAG: dephospho-CoA kinase [Proteobacteria bacterium]|nr:dephospho-CoA kinase [Pseudomonadota bacterium]